MHKPGFEERAEEEWGEGGGFFHVEAKKRPGAQEREFRVGLGVGVGCWGRLRCLPSDR